MNAQGEVGGRVFITGAAVRTPSGDLDATMAALLEGRTTAAAIRGWDATGLPTRIACQVRDEDMTWSATARELRRLGRASVLALDAAVMALGLAGLEPRERSSRDVAVVLGTGGGGIALLDEGTLRSPEGAKGRISPLLIPMLMSNSSAAVLSLHLGLSGSALTLGTACASGTDAIGMATRMVQSGQAEIVLAGGVDALICPSVVAGFGRMGALSRRNDDPAAASRPFDSQRDGFVMGEGAGFVVLESERSAAARGATPLGTVTGYASTSDAHHLTAPDPEGYQATRCLHAALADAGIDRGGIVHVNAHGTSTSLNDATEATVLARVFGSDCPPITTVKGTIGHLLGAAGAVEAVVALECSRRGVVPPIANLESPDLACQLDLVAKAPRVVPVGRVLSCSFAFGGHNAALVIDPAI